MRGGALWRGFWLALAVGLLAGCSPMVALLNLAVPRDGYRIVRDLAYGPGSRQRLDLYIPDHAASGAPVMLFFYGGSWETGSKSLYLAFGQAFASKGILVAIADYRLYPAIRYPAFLEDSARAFAFLRAHAAEYGGNPQRLFLAGHSAGAYNAVMLAAEPRLLREAGADISQVRGVIGIAGPYDFLPLVDRNLIDLFGGKVRTETQPINHVDGRRPPMLLVTGDADTVVEPRNTYNLAKKLQSFGSAADVRTYPGIGHVGIILSLAPGFRFRTPLRQDILRFMEAH